MLAAGLMRVLGDRPAAGGAIHLAAVIAVSLQLALLPLLAGALRLGWPAGVIAALAWLAARIDVSPWWEGSYAGLLAVAGTWVFLRVGSADRPSRAGALLIGAWAGVLLLLSPSALLVILAAFAWALLRRPGGLPARRVTLAMLAASAVLAPWFIRNYAAFGRVFFVRDNLGLELSVSNNPCAAFGLRENLANGCFDAGHPNVNAGEALKVRVMGEAEYNGARLREGLEWIAANKARFLALTAERVGAFWFPTDGGNRLLDLTRPERRAARAVVYLMTLLSAAGLFVLWRRKEWRALAACGAWLLFFPPIYYLVQFDDRYRYPVLWATLLPGGFAVWTVLEWGWRRAARRHEAQPLIRAARGSS
jgi:hypothetical protein